jgi:uncharacterized membrane protein YiaA
MEKGDRYRLVIIIAYALLIISGIILLAGLWNNLSMNPAAQVGNGLYFLVLLILILATAIFVLHILEERWEAMKIVNIHPGGYVKPSQKIRASSNS